MKSEKGQAAVEFALILPILLLLVFGIIDFGRVLYAKNSLVSICQQTTRAVSIQYGISGKLDNDPQDISDTGKLKVNYVSTYNGEKLDLSNLQVNSFVYTSNNVVIELKYKITFITPYMSFAFPKESDGNYWLYSSATFRLE